MVGGHVGDAIEGSSGMQDGCSLIGRGTVSRRRAETTEVVREWSGRKGVQDGCAECQTEGAWGAVVTQGDAEAGRKVTQMGMTSS